MEHAPRLERSALVVDDDVFMLSALAELLEEDGFDVQTATNGFSALRRAIEARPSVILLDLMLPERSGAELLDDLRADPATRYLAVVLVTGFAERLTDVELTQFDGVVTKPFDACDLLETVHYAMQRAACRPAEVAPVQTLSHRDASLRTRHAMPGRRTPGRRA